MYINQKAYIEKILERFGMTDCKPSPTPMEFNCKLTKPDNLDKSQMQMYPYQSLIGVLMYLVVSTRPDIAYTVNYFSQFNTNYSIDHWKTAKRVLRYLKDTIECGVMYEKTGLPLFGVVDADWE